jgi:hypothetical protein
MVATVSMLWWFPVCSSMLLQSLLTVGAQGLGTVVCCLFSFPTSSSHLLPTCCWPSCHLFTDGSHASLPPCPYTLLQWAFSHPCPLHCALVFSSIVFQFSFFLQVGGISLSRGFVLVYPRVGWGIPCNAWLSLIWSSNGLPSPFGACIQQRQCWWWYGGGGPLLFSVYHGMEKPSMG